MGKGSGAGGARGGGGGGRAKQSDVNNAAQEYVQNHLNQGETFGTVESAKVVSPIDANGYADVKIETRKSVQITLGIDPETGRMEYDYDTEYQRFTTRLKVRQS